MMDQEKIGKFIAACRKEKGLTQAALAEQLGITDRAVSKWETGKSLPDSSIMIDLCELLSINVNDLLKGERVMTDNLNKVSEELILSLKEQAEQKDKQLLSLEIGFGIVAMIVALIMILSGAYLAENYSSTFGFVLIIVGAVSAFVFAFIGVWIEQIAGYYKCTKCGHAYKPTYINTLMAPHIGRSRRMKCPCCGDKNYHKKVLSA